MRFESRRLVVQRVVSLSLVTLLTPIALAVAGLQGSGGAVQEAFGLTSERLSGTVVVLPFDNISGGADDEWIGEGIADTVGVDLRNAYGMRVIRIDAEGVASVELDPLATITELVAFGRDQRANWVVTGGYQRVGELMRVTARLIETSSGEVVQTVKLDGEVNGLFGLQDRIVDELSRMIPAEARSDLGGTFASRSSRTTMTEEAAPSGNAGIRITERGSDAGEMTLRPAVPIVPTATGSGPRSMPYRLNEAPEIDGQLDDPVWNDVVPISDFVQMNPLEGAPASEATDVYLAYDSDNFYVGIHARYSDLSLIRANRVERDQTIRDDKVTIFFDPFLDQQRAYIFSVNGYGVQGDATMDSSGMSRGGRRQQNRGPNSNQPGVVPTGDTSWDALFASAGTLGVDGWTAEIAIPFKSLRYPARSAASPHQWGFQIVRNIESKDERAVWSPVSRGVVGFLTQMGTLEGMTNLSASRNLEFLPTVTGFKAGSLDRTTGAFREQEFSPEAGLNVKYGITSNVTMEFTVNPDFSQIESDQPQIEVNQRFPLFFSELRPFFLEGQEIFNVVAPISFVHTRTIVDPRVGAKITGKLGQSTFAVLAADDEAPGKRDDEADPAFGKTAQSVIGRYRYDLYGSSYVGALVTDREFMNGYNRVMEVDGQFRVGSTDRFNFVLGRSQSREEDGEELVGPPGGVMWRHNGRNLSFTSFNWVTSPEFRNQSGFVRRVDEKTFRNDVSYRWWPENWLVNWGPRVSYLRNFDFSGTLQDESIGAGVDLSFAKSIVAGLGLNRAMERFGGINFWKSNYSTSFSVNTSRLISVEGDFSWGDGIFFSASPFLGRSRNGRILSSIRPFSRLQADLSLDFSHLDNPVTGSKVFDVKIFRAFTTYQFTERFMLRNITEYNSFDKKLDANILFTYRLNSGTVLFVGYDDHYQQGDFIDFGETLAERFLVASRLQRTNRAFFTKFSYLFRY